MRVLKGELLLPPVVLARSADLILEVRDISLADAPSAVVAEERRSQVALSSNGRIYFELPVPETPAGSSLTLRAHFSVDGSNRVSSGDLLTTAIYPVPDVGDPPPIVARVETV